MKSSLNTTFTQPSYLESDCENSNSSSLKSNDSSLNTLNESADYDQADSWSTYTETSRVEAWCLQDQYNSLLY